MIQRLIRSIIAVLVFAPNVSKADHGHPLAVRGWPNGVVSIETHWNFKVAIDLFSSPSLPSELDDADLLLRPVAGQPQQLQTRLRNVHPDTGVSEDSAMTLEISDLNMHLDRVVNQWQATLLSDAEATFVSKNAVSFSLLQDAWLVVAADGVRIALPLNTQFNRLEELADEESPLMDAVVFPRAGSMTTEQFDAALKSVEELKSRFAVIFEEVDSSRQEFVELKGNSLALRQHDTAADSEVKTQWLQLQQAPWQMPKELADLFANKEAACSSTQSVFAKLSVAQLNFKPENGTHTPRWNAEHMMGRELLFFSQIYAQQSPEIRSMDLNPKQMPPDYEAKNPDWDGREEARQLQRVSAFASRFAYLLDELELDKKAPGSSWTLRGLLVQMENHYSEHTANVVKKFDLPDWVKE